MKYFYISAFFLLLTGCGSFVPVIDTSEVPPETLQQAYAVQAFTTGSNSGYPPIQQYLGNITAFSCKHLLTDPPASRGDALLQLRLKALELGANGIIDLTYDERGTDTFGTNCWETVQASGVAVEF